MSEAETQSSPSSPSVDIAEFQAKCKTLWENDIASVRDEESGTEALEVYRYIVSSVLTDPKAKVALVATWCGPDITETGPDGDAIKTTYKLKQSDIKWDEIYDLIDEGWYDRCKVVNQVLFRWVKIKEDVESTDTSLGLVFSDIIKDQIQDKK
ncbi:hypothetical protein BDV96DRAFT_600356 [Lophiotrema nucula]|uniref:Uncharacterized protein n=1 Tax=Lophiotrema nucula TaxID=690887 RepID=A0A6A5Z6D8_9PLEO|nr:hypothetical protein BDV96DRAFT_600356 [Lophiotrema nucula]